METRRLGAATVGVAAFWAVVILYAVHSALPSNALRLPLAGSVRADRLLPQGWGFFTREPQEPDMLTYVLDDGTWRPADLGPHSDPSNFFGLDRASKTQRVELGWLTLRLTPRDWRTCSEPGFDCFERLTPVVASNISWEPTLCDDVVLTKVRPIPWAWANSDLERSYPIRAARLKVAC